MIIKARKSKLKRKIKAKTIGKLKREIKKTVNPFYGNKARGLLKTGKNLFIIRLIIRKFFL